MIKLILYHFVRTAEYVELDVYPGLPLPNIYCTQSSIKDVNVRFQVENIGVQVTTIMRAE